MRKTLALVLAFLMAFAFVGALAEGGEEITLTYGKEFDFDGKTFLEGQDLENNYYLDYAYEKHKVKVEYTWVLDDDAQKDALAVANGDMPDVMLVDLTTFNMLVESDMIQPLTQAFDENANQYLRDARDTYPEAFAAATVGGELMAIPDTVPKKQHVYTWVRKDWLDKLGLEVPTTMDDIIAVAKAFIEQDPDGNGENDTIGLPLNTNIIGRYGSDYMADPIANAMGSYARMWYEGEDGKVVYGSVTEETRNALEYLAKLYAEGIFDPQFAVREEKELVISGKCGIFFGSWCAGPLRQSYGFDQAEWIPVVAPIEGEGATYYTMSPVPANSYLVVSKKCAHPEAVIWMLGDTYEFHRYLTGDDEWTAKMNEYNTAGVSWTIMPFEIQLEAEDIVAVRGKDMVQMIDTGDRTGISLQNQGFYDAYLAWLDDNTSLTGWVRYVGMYLGCNIANYEHNDYKQPVFWGTTETMQDYWTTLTSLEDETFMKIVMNEVGIEAFDDFVKQWHAEGGDTIIEEVQEYVDARK
ncbi:MAG: extracellular solute-binding protein [Clostridia bacterium]|nr:extracellular solute-binding protein [Clostridia bacterium]